MKYFLHKMGVLIAIILLSGGLSGCDMIYGLLHKPGGEERQILGRFEFNEYNAKVEDLQKILKIFGYPIGRPDGKFGASTRDVVARFQADESLAVTRFVDKATWEKISHYAAVFVTEKKQINGHAVQQALKKAGYLPGKVDGQIGPKTREAVKAFQAAEGLSADGNIGLKTMKCLLKYLEPSVEAKP